MKKICIIIALLFLVLFPIKVNASEATCHYDVEYEHDDSVFKGNVIVTYKNNKLSVSYNIDNDPSGAIISKITKDHKIVLGDIMSNGKLKCKDQIFSAVFYQYNIGDYSYLFYFSGAIDDTTYLVSVETGNLNPNKSFILNDSEGVEYKETTCNYIDYRYDHSFKMTFDTIGNIKITPTDSSLYCDKGTTTIKFSVQDLNGKCPDKLYADLGGKTYEDRGRCFISFCTAEYSSACTYLEGKTPNEFVGTKFDYNGKKCTVTSTNKVSTCRDGGYTKFTYKDGEAACADNNNNIKKIIKSNNDFDNYFNDGKKTPVCPTTNDNDKYRYIMYNEYCYQCLFIDDKPDKFNKDCSVFVEVTRPIWRAIRIVAPILAVVLGAFDFLKATASSDEKDMKKATNTFVKRLIMLALLFLLTYIVNFIVGLANGVDLGDITKCL